MPLCVATSPFCRLSSTTCEPSARVRTAPFLPGMIFTVSFAAATTGGAAFLLPVHR